MRRSVNLPIVSDCSVVECAYNTGQRCFAKAITVGDEAHAACDTFFPSQRHCSSGTEAGVGPCKVTACRHNDDFSCSAEAIRVGRHASHADCLTFEAR